ncbi:MAG: hypothetical protein H0W89_07930 [Candidatus Levybacteria bacterium]|nr:hypothetical protein [Candidatus Levybacteria bacterium]
MANTERPNADGTSFPPLTEEYRFDMIEANRIEDETEESRGKVAEKESFQLGRELLAAGHPIDGERNGTEKRVIGGQTISTEIQRYRTEPFEHNGINYYLEGYVNIHTGQRGWKTPRPDLDFTIRRQLAAAPFEGDPIRNGFIRRLDAISGQSASSFSADGRTITGKAIGDTDKRLAVRRLLGKFEEQQALQPTRGKKIRP